MSCRRTCRSGEWRAGRIWRRWVMHLSWITSRGQHLLVSAPARLSPAAPQTCAVDRNHMIEPRTAGPISREQQSYWKCLLQINPRKTLLSLSCSPPERLSSFIHFPFLYNSTALKTKTQQRFILKRLCLELHIIIPLKPVLQYIYCIYTRMTLHLLKCVVYNREHWFDWILQKWIIK